MDIKGSLSAREVILEVKNVPGEFHGMQALNNISSRAAEVEIHRLVDGNGF